jgi:hypothetical protein
MRQNLRPIQPVLTMHNSDCFTLGPSFLIRKSRLLDTSWEGWIPGLEREVKRPGSKVQLPLNPA